MSVDCIEKLPFVCELYVEVIYVLIFVEQFIYLDQFRLQLVKHALE